MKNKWKIAAGVTILSFLFLLLLGFMEITEKERAEETDKRIWHHEMAADADPTVGSDTIPEDYEVDKTFTSHLPLVILDTGGKEITNYKYFDAETDSFIIPENVDPYVSMEISVIDNENHINQLGDMPSLVSSGKIKIRGNSSSTNTYPKKQYLIKLLTEDGDKNNQEMMGMSSSDTWILNGTLSDRSYLRNYVAMNTGGEISPYTPDIRFCEMVIKSDSQYQYMGLYGMYEKVEQGTGRVEIQTASMDEDTAGLSYLLQRDRKENKEKNMEVWSTQNVRSNNWLNLEYPSSEKITEEYWEMIQKDIRSIEAALYGESRKQFYQYRTMLDVDSFVDYFIINEFFANYDAGWNSTFLYKDKNEKLAIGPFWDFDNAMDNYKEENLEIRKLAFHESPWFDRLVTDHEFVRLVQLRYRQLRKTILSDEVLKEKIEQACVFLEKPIKRDLCRWQNLYTNRMNNVRDAETGLWVDRNPETWEGEVQRMQDVLLEHGDYMDKNLSTNLDSFVEYEKVEGPDLFLALLSVVFIIAFFVSIILVQRVRNGS